MKKQMGFSLISVILLSAVLLNVGTDSSAKGMTIANIANTETVIYHIPEPSTFSTKPDFNYDGWCNYTATGVWCVYDPYWFGADSCYWIGGDNTRGCGVDSTTFGCCNTWLI